MYPPRFDLRHFMSHLAPGGYCFLQLSLFVIFTLWLFCPETLANLGVKLNAANQVLLIFGFLIISVLCYFIGVALRLPSVDEIDDISAENELRGKFKELIPRVKQLAYLLYRPVWKTRPFTCKQVYTLLKGTKEVPQELREDKVDLLIQTLEQEQKTDSNECFRDWLMRIATKYLKEAREEAILSGRAVAELLKDPERKWVINWLWAADSFPYPLWLSYTTYLFAGLERHQEFEQRLWPVILETMRGEVSEITLTKVPFNRCKLFVMTRSPELASDVYDREALTRMMAGFYRGLRLGSRLLALLTLLSIVLWGFKQLGIFEYVALISSFSLLFNGYLLIKVADNFRMLRMSESDAVFSSYLIALSLNSEQA